MRDNKIIHLSGDIDGACPAEESKSFARILKTIAQRSVVRDEGFHYKIESLP